MGPFTDGRAQSTRLDVMLFLLVQLVLGSRPPGEGLAGLSNPWTEYVKFLPGQVPLPTLWTEMERALLRGTSLEVGSRRPTLQNPHVSGGG